MMFMQIEKIGSRKNYKQLSRARLSLSAEKKMMSIKMKSKKMLKEIASC